MTYTLEFYWLYQTVIIFFLFFFFKSTGIILIPIYMSMCFKKILKWSVRRKNGVWGLQSEVLVFSYGREVPAQCSVWKLLQIASIWHWVLCGQCSCLPVTAGAIFGKHGLKGGFLSEVLWFSVRTRKSLLMIYLEVLIFNYHMVLSPEWVISSLVHYKVILRLCDFMVGEIGDFFQKLWCLGGFQLFGL